MTSENTPPTRTSGSDIGPSDSRESPLRPLRRIHLDIVLCLVLGFASMLIYNSNLRAIPAADTYAARYLPLSILRNHTVALNPIVEAVAQGRHVPNKEGEPDAAWWIRYGHGGRLVSLYPIVLPVLIAPLYFPAALYLNANNWEPLLVDEVARIMEKLVASLLATASVMLLYFLIRRRADPKTATLLALTFAFGTTTWVISSQALWMHGLAELLVVATLLLLTGPCTNLRAATAGVLCALIPCTRQPDAILAAGLGLYGLWWARRMTPLFLAASALPLGLLLAYNLQFVGHVVGGYGSLSATRVSEFLNDNVLEGFAGLLFSPTRGLFVYSPFLLFIPFCLHLAMRDRSRGLTGLIACAAVLQVSFYAFGDWRQGASWGSRWLTDMLPILFWMLPPIVAALSFAGRIVFAAACCVAIAIEAIGAFWYKGASDAAIFAPTGPNRMEAAWDIRNAPFIGALQHPRAPADLFLALQGNIDLVAARDVTESAVRQIEVHGWALTNSRSPADVAVRVDGQVVAGTASFFERPDVVRTLREKSPSGWKVAFAAERLAPGEHTVTAMVRGQSGGESRLLKSQTFTIALPDRADGPARELENATRTAVNVLVERQKEPGYWLTALTKTMRFDQPDQEMNTFLNAMMIDVLAPVAERAGLVRALGRTRAFLTRQIEPDGLVRYHGRPDAPTIGRLGCMITPDADDTALTWRIAPSEDRGQLMMALATLSTFRTTGGLYRTWLAPRDHYECLDPGNDPNPADFVIQLHVLMLLMKVDQEAARTLCHSLQKQADDKSIWVYYELAPLLPILRLGELAEAGCPLKVPETRLQSSVSGQEIWVEAFRLLRPRDAAEDRTSASSRTATLLQKLAENNFSLLARNPPLLYHNDLTGTVPRFYWSEDLGYALWLRLYFEHEGAGKR